MERGVTGVRMTVLEARQQISLFDRRALVAET